MKMKRTALIALLCLVLCVSLLPVSAFAEQTVIIIPSATQQAPAAQSSNTATTVVMNDSTTSVVIANNNGAATSQAQKNSNAVIVMPNGTVVNNQTIQTQVAPTTQTTVERPVAAQTAAVDNNSLLSGIFKRINEARVNNGLGVLGYDTALQMTADIRAKESSESFGHTRPDGSAAVTAVTVDYNVAGENLIQVNKEYASVDLLVETWLASDAHRANIMLADFSQTALGIYETNGVIYISQIFTD